MLLQLSLLVLFCSGITTTLVEFENGAYTDILVAFDTGKIRTRKQVENLEKLIKVASQVLYNATDGLAFFKEVRITLSHFGKEFGRDKIEHRSTSFSRADIWIGSPSVEHETPDLFTLQTGGCGEQGKFILLSDSFIRDLSENTIKLAGQHLVQEWARYRYGVFDEQESFLWEGNQISPAACIDGIQGWAMTEYHEQCVLECGRVRSNCRFFPDPKSDSSVESSLMSYPHLPKARRFCNISNHNMKAPSKQNRMCNSKSIKEVILEHEDFNDKHRWLNTRKKVPLQETNVIWVYGAGIYLYIVFFVESSQRMDQENGVQEVQHFIERFLVHLAPRTASAGFIKFSNEIKRLGGKWKVDKKDDWPNIIKWIVSTRVGSPSATPDIDEALKVAFKDGYGFPTFILISTGDGKIDEVKQYKSWKTTNRRIPTIHSIVIGRNVSWKLDHLSQMHGGDSYFLGDARSRGRQPRSFNLDMAFLASMHAVVEDHELPVVIRYERFTLESQRKQYDYDFRVDDGIGKELVITFSPNYTRYQLFNPHLDSPPEKTHRSESGSIAKSIYVDDAKPGRWTLELWRDYIHEEDYVDIMITAKLRANCRLQGSCVLVRAWITNVPEDEKGRGTKGYHRIYAEVKKGFNPVIHATVVATVQIMDQRGPINVTLRDNGGAPDIFKDDGIYSNFFPVTIRPAGKPIVIVRVANEGEKAWVKIADTKKGRSTHGILDAGDYERIAKRKFGESKSRFSADNFRTQSTSDYHCKQRKESERAFAVPLPPFTRATMANSPTLFPLNEDEVRKTPPTMIWDFKVVHEFVRANVFFAVLQWTSPEHPRPRMKVETIEIHGSRELMTLKDSRSENIFYFLYDVSPAGQVQQSEVRIPESMVKDSAGKVHSVYLALRARDGKRNAGGMSNIAEAFFERFHDVEEIKGREEAAKGKAGSTSWVPLTVVAVVVIVAAVIGAVGYLMWKKKKKKGWMPNASVAFQQKESEHSH